MNVETMEMTEIWDQIDAKLNGEPEPIRALKVSYAFHLSGEDGGSYGLKLNDGKAEIIREDPGDVDCSLSMSTKDFKKLLAGNLNSTAAFMMGKLKVKGNIGLALKLETLLKQYSF
ncbi:SCP2 sterol-binding domain-containing protein [Sporosarcina cyprini]|uniref:SCP2 sterol-binding domain-containing protein n=1 Tax=Sporosarcina cyprini TaxID=2910523 RepID=UPI001EDEAAAE|nr:SCP2 sterol-binding domain-containing protein [Sporosarcina cyprini]MCG3088207.1 SCP2 sterol-binding domain-containing protein [Sporosarcina cyprini]